MPDPLSITGGIIAVLNLTCTVTKYLVDSKDASKDCLEILIELSVARGVLTTLKDSADRVKADPTWLATIESLNVPNGPLAHFKATLEDLLSRVEPLSKSKRAVRTLTWPFKKQEVKAILQAIERQKSLFILALQNDNLALSQQIKSDLNDMKEVVHQLGRASINEQDRKILDWLSPLDPQKRHQDIRSRRSPGSGVWLMERLEFQQWLNDFNSPTILWCPGTPGAGKSVLSSLVIDELIKLSDKRPVNLAYFYYDYTDEGSQTNVNVVGSLLKQIVSHSPSVPDLVKDLYHKSKDGRDPPQLEKLFPVLEEVSRDDGSVIIIIDALDESPQGRPRQDILEIIKELGKASARLLITSRTHVDGITHSLSCYPQIVIEADISDVGKYIVESIEQDESISDIIDEPLRDEIVKAICQSSEGMFLLPALQIQNIVNQTTKAEVRQALRETPRELSEVFEQSLHRIEQQPPSRSRLAIRVLSWLSHLRDQLSIEGLRCALAVRKGDSCLDPDNLPSLKLMIESCFGLVNIDESGSSIRLLHYSLQEYLSENRSQTLATAQQDITNTCLTYLILSKIHLKFPHEGSHNGPFLASDHWLYRANSSFKINSIESGRNEAMFEIHDRDLDFFRYAMNNWYGHAQDCPLAAYKALVLDFLSDRSRRDFCTMVHDKDCNSFYTRSNCSGTLYLASRLNLAELVHYLVRDEALAIDSVDDLGDTPLHVAVCSNALEAARVLLSLGADTEIQADGSFSSRYGGTPLHFALDQDDTSMIKLLLEYPVDVNAIIHDIMTVLDQANERLGYNKGNQMYIECVRILKEHGALTWEQLEAKNAHAECIKDLKEYGALTLEELKAKNTLPSKERSNSLD